MLGIKLMQMKLASQIPRRLSLKNTPNWRKKVQRGSTMSGMTRSLRVCITAVSCKRANRKRFRRQAPPLGPAHLAAITAWIPGQSVPRVFSLRRPLRRCVSITNPIRLRKPKRGAIQPTALSGKPGLYGGGFYSDPNFVKDENSNLSLGAYKWTGFFLGMGMAHQWPAVRLAVWRRPETVPFLLR